MRHRSTLVHIPHGIPSGKRVPLVLALHGAGSSGPKMEHYSGFSHASDLNRFIVAYPDSVGEFWNSNGAKAGPDDAGFVGAVIDELQETLCVDPQRIFATGVSSGGSMVALLACSLAGRLAAIAPVAGVYAGPTACRVNQPLSVLEIHGTADQVAPYAGVRGAAAGSDPPPFVKGWIHRDRCQRTAATQRLAARTMIYRWGGCLGGVNVEHVRILAGGHQWPGALPPDPGPPSTICAACVIWSFFSHRSLVSGGSGGVGA